MFVNRHSLRGWLVLCAGAGLVAGCADRPSGFTEASPDGWPDERASDEGAAPDTPACTGELSFAPMATYRAAAVAAGVEIADLDGDRRPDLVVPTWRYGLEGGYDLTMVFLNKGDGSYESAVEYAPDQDLVALGDLNGDGRPDLVVTAPLQSALTVFLNDGGGRFTARPAMTLRGAPTEALQGGVGDVDGDGRPDLYWSTGGTLSALHGDGDGTLASTPVTTTFAGAAHLKVMDLDGDHVIDVVGTGAGASFDVFLNDGHGVFPSRGAGYSPAAGVTGWFFTDWNGDGRPDIFAADTTCTVLLNSGRGTFETQIALSPPATSTPPDYMTVADMNGDGRPDLVQGVGRGARDTIEVWLNDGHDAFTTTVSAQGPRYGSTIQAVDLDGDRRLDLVMLSQPTAHSSEVNVLHNDMCSP